MSPYPSSSGKDSGAARVLGSGASGQYVFYKTRFAIRILICIWGLFFFIGVAELLIFHPVDTVAKRLMSNKAKVCNLFSFTSSTSNDNVDFYKTRFLSQHCHPSSSGTLLQLPLHENFYHCSLVLDMLLDTKLHNECTSLVVNRGLTTSSTSTTSQALLILLVSVKGR